MALSPSTVALTDAGSEVSLVPPGASVALCVMGLGGSGAGRYVSGPVAPHVDLHRSGFTIGWRMYWPREGQHSGLASGCVQEGGLLFVKGVPGVDDDSRQSAGPFMVIGARTLPGRVVQGFISSGEGEFVSVTGTTPLQEGKWADVSLSFGSMNSDDAAVDAAERHFLLYVNGHVDGVKLPAAMVKSSRKSKRTTEVVVESIHPYVDNMDTRHPVRIPGASRITVVFDPLTATEQVCACDVCVWCGVVLHAH